MHDCVKALVREWQAHGACGDEAHAATCALSCRSARGGPKTSHREVAPHDGASSRTRQIQAGMPATAAQIKKEHSGSEREPPSQLTGLRECCVADDVQIRADASSFHGAFGCSALTIMPRPKPFDGA